MRSLPRTNSATGTRVTSAPLRRIERPVPKNRFFTSCCVMVEAREAHRKGSINERGHFQSGGAMGFEIHVKDEARFPGKWAFFSFDSSSSNGTLIPQGAPCYTCHTAHAAVDTTFVQFYPTLLPVAT